MVEDEHTVNTYSINRLSSNPRANDQDSHKVSLYETSRAPFGARKMTSTEISKKLSLLAPIPARKGGFLRKGEGNGGSPSNFVLKQSVNEKGQATLEPIALRPGALSTVR